jgi:2-polyprenyl-3-methyl-5-hydroxy-6-metoxy-1,4-benzoquinol methylase
MFKKLEDINSRPLPFEFYTAEELWTDEYTSAQMLEFHLNESIDLSSRNHAFIDRSIEWIVSHFNIKSDTMIADFGCGPGLYTNCLAQTDADVTGVDFSQRSIDYAKTAAAEKNLVITYLRQNYRDFDTD